MQTAKAGKVKTPEIVRDVASLRAKVWAGRKRDETVGLIPTMGALHRGHCSLIEQMRTHTDDVVVSIFVNPTQFNEPADLDAYPRQLATDLAACRERGVDVVHVPAEQGTCTGGRARLGW